MFCFATLYVGRYVPQGAGTDTVHRCFVPFPCPGSLESEAGHFETLRTPRARLPVKPWLRATVQSLCKFAVQKLSASELRLHASIQQQQIPCWCSLKLHLLRSLKRKYVSKGLYWYLIFSIVSQWSICMYIIFILLTFSTVTLFYLWIDWFPAYWFCHWCVLSHHNWYPRHYWNKYSSKNICKHVR